MATVYGTNRTLLNNVPKEKVPHGENGGRVRCIYDTYTSAGAMTSGDIVQLGDLIPKGARVIDVLLKYTDHGTTGTAKLGYAASADAVEAADDDAFGSSIDLNAAADVLYGSQIIAAPAGVGKSFAAAVQPQLELTANTTAAGTFTLMIMYVID